MKSQFKTGRKYKTVNISQQHLSYENSLDVGAASFMAFSCYLIGTLISRKFDEHRHFAETL
jgi:hypothetical protein